MLLFAQIQLHDHPSVFGVAEIFAAIAAEFSVCLCHIAAQRRRELWYASDMASKTRKPHTKPIPANNFFQKFIPRTSSAYSAASVSSNRSIQCGSSFLHIKRFFTKKSLKARESTVS